MSNVDKDVGKLETSYAGSKNGTVTLVNSLTVPQRFK